MTRRRFSRHVSAAWLAITLASAGMATAQTRPSTQPASRRTTRPVAHANVPTDQISGPVLRFERVWLDNGIEGLLLRDQAAPMVGVFAVVRAGLAFEAPGEDGLSHFLEHLLFNGTESLTQDELYAAVDAIGGYSNATTRRDHTLFQMLVPRQHLERALALHVEMLFHSTIPAEKFEKERGIVLEEIARDSTRPGTVVDDALRRVAWAGTPLGRPVLGSPETLGAIERDAVVDYWRRNYLPQNVQVLVVGDCDPKRFRSALEATYGAVAATTSYGRNVDGRMPAPKRSTLHTVTLDTTDGTPVSMYIAWPGPAATHADSWALDVLAGIASSDPRAGLRHQLEAAGLAVTGASAGLEKTAGSTAFIVHVDAAGDTGPQALAEAAAAAVRSIAGSLDATAVDGYRLRHAIAAASLAERPHYLGIEKSTDLVNIGAGAVESESAAIAAVHPAAIAGAGRRWLDGPFVAVVGAPGAEAKLTTLTRAAASEIATTAGTPHSVTRHLDNGLTLHVQSTPGAALLATHVLIRDRGACDAAFGRGRGELLARLLPSLPGLEAELQAIGASLKTSDDPRIPYDDYYNVPDYGYIRVETLDLFLDEAATAVRRVVAAATAIADLDDEALARATTELRAASAQASTSPDALSRQLMREALFGRDHPLAIPILGDDADVDREELAEYAHRYLDPAGLIVTVQTGLEAEQVADRLAAELSSLATTSPAAPRAPELPSAPISRGLSLAKAQAYVRMGSVIDVADTDRAPLSLALSVLSERLAMDIREARGMAYSIGAGLELRGTAGPDAWLASAGTRPENVDQVGEAMRRIITELQTNPPTDDETRLAASRTQGRALMRRLSAMGRAWADGVDLWRGDSPGASLQRVEALDRVSAEAVRQMIQRYLDPAKLSVVVVR